MVWFIVIYYSLQLLWNDSFPCKSLSHKLRHFLSCFPICVSLYFPNFNPVVICSLNFFPQTITNPPYARLASNVFDKPYTNCIIQEALNFKRQKLNSDSVKNKKDSIFSHSKEGQQCIAGGKCISDLDLVPTLFLLVLRPCLWISLSTTAEGLSAMWGRWRKQSSCYMFTSLSAERKRFFNLQLEWKILAMEFN